MCCQSLANGCSLAVLIVSTQNTDGPDSLASSHFGILVCFCWAWFSPFRQNSSRRKITWSGRLEIIRIRHFFFPWNIQAREMKIKPPAFWSSSAISGFRAEKSFMFHGTRRVLTNRGPVEFGQGHSRLSFLVRRSKTPLQGQVDNKGRH